MEEDEIEKQTEELRGRLLEEREGKGGKGEREEGEGKDGRDGKRRQFKAHQVHEQAEAKIVESERLRRALGISKDYEEGGHWRKQDERMREGLVDGSGEQQAR